MIENTLLFWTIRRCFRKSYTRDCDNSVFRCPLAYRPNRRDQAEDPFERLDSTVYQAVWSYLTAYFDPIQFYRQANDPLARRHSGTEDRNRKANKLKIWIFKANNWWIILVPVNFNLNSPTVKLFTKFLFVCMQCRSVITFQSIV